MLALSACGPLHIGTAATVGPHRITEQQLREVLARTQADPTAARSAGSSAALARDVLSRLVDHDLLVKLAAAHGVHFTAQQIDQAQAALVKQAGGLAALKAQAAQGGIAPADLRSAVEDLLLREAVLQGLTGGRQLSATQSSQLLAQAVALEARAEHVDVSPRFGVFQAGQIVAGGGAQRLSSPAAVAPALGAP